MPADAAFGTVPATGSGRETPLPTYPPGAPRGRSGSCAASQPFTSVRPKSGMRPVSRSTRMCILKNLLLTFHFTLSHSPLLPSFTPVESGTRLIVLPRTRSSIPFLSNFGTVFPILFHMEE